LAQCACGGKNLEEEKSLLGGVELTGADCRNTRTTE